jgi:hypothetical protein
MWIVLSVAALGVVAVLYWQLRKKLAISRIEALIDKRRPTSRMVSGGEFVDGNRHLKVALALTNSDLFYENLDMEASLDLRWVREIEYDTSLATGQSVDSGKVLRIRSFSQTFEFVLPTEFVQRWLVALPPRALAPSESLTELAMRVANAT